MEKSELFEILDSMVEIMGAKETLEALAMSLSSKELEDNLKFIDRMYETNLF